MNRKLSPGKYWIPVIATAAALFCGCATSSASMPTVQQLAAWGALAPGTDPSAMERGRVLAVTECAACHRLYWPHERTASEWPRIIRNMGKRASLDAKQIEDLTLYMVTSSTLARDSGRSH